MALSDVQKPSTERLVHEEQVWRKSWGSWQLLAGERGLGRDFKRSVATPKAKLEPQGANLCQCLISAKLLSAAEAPLKDTTFSSTPDGN